MSTRSSSSGDGVNWAFVGLLATGVAVLIAYYASPEDSTIRKSIREAPAVAASIPDRTKQLMDQLRNRLEQAKETFRGAKVESETSLVRQLNDAKRRGSVGPVLG